MRVSLLVAALLVIDPVFIRGAIVGRGDVIAVAFILLGLLCYIYVGKSEVNYLLSGFLTGLATLIHPLGIIGFVSVFILSLIERNQDTGRSRRAIYFTLPLFFLLFLWGLYAMQDLEVFLKQFFGQKGEQTSIRITDLLFLLFFVKTYFYSTPVWINNALVFYPILSCFVIIFLGLLVYYIKNRGEWNAIIVCVFLASSIIAYTFGPLRHSMWYNIYVQPFLYLSVGLLFANRRRLIAGASRTQDVLFKYAMPLSILVVFLFFFSVDGFILARTLNSSTSYLEFGSEILALIPDGSTVLIASSPDPYFVLKNSGKNLTLYTFVHMGSYPMEESYKRIFPEVDYFVFSGTPEKHFMSPYDVRLLDEFIRDNTTLDGVVGKNTDYYTAVIYKVRVSKD